MSWPKALEISTKFPPNTADEKYLERQNFFFFNFLIVDYAIWSSLSRSRLVKKAYVAEPDKLFSLFQGVSILSMKLKMINSRAYDTGKKM
jgi:hypothetical protein